MAGYAAYSVDDQYRMITAERDHHVPRLVAAAAMWRDVTGWLDYQCASLRTETDNLIRSWPDEAGRLFGEQVRRGLNTILSWHDTSLPLAAVMPGMTNLTGSVNASHVVDRINDLVAAIQTAQPQAARLRDNYNSLPAHLKPLLEQRARNDLGAVLDALVPKYAEVGDAMAKAVGKAWDGPRAEAPQGPGTPGPSAAGPGPTAQPTTGGPQEPGAPAHPDGPSAPTQPDSAQPSENLLDDGTKLVDALSQAAQSAQQLLGGTGGDLSGLVPQAGDFDPADLASMSPADLTNYLRHLDGDAGGLPALAGLDGGGAGGLGGASGFGGAALPALGGSGQLGDAATAPPGIGGMPVPASASPPSSTGAGATGGGMPPMYPHRAAGAKPGGGIKPGDAEEAHTSRARKPSAMPGVSLHGRAGKGRKAAPAAPADRRAHPAADDWVLDEDLWQVQEDTEPRRVLWPRQK